METGNIKGMNVFFQEQSNSKIPELVLLKKQKTKQKHPQKNALNTL